MSELGELVLAAQNKDQHAIELLYTAYYQEIYTTAYSYLSDSYAAEDAAQDAFLSVIEHLDQLRNPEVFHSWMRRIVTNRCLTYLRKNGRYCEIPTEDEIMEPSLSTEGGRYTSLVPHEQLDEKETARLMYQILSDLSEKHKTVIYMFYYSEMSIEQIAEELQISTGTVKSRLSYARQCVKKELLALEKQGTKLYHLDTFSDLVRIIRTVADSSPLKGSFASLMNALSPAAASSAANTAGTVSAASSQAMTVGLTHAASAGAASSMSNSLAVKISLGVSAVTMAAIIGVGTVNNVILPLTSREPSEEKTTTTETTTLLPDTPAPDLPGGGLTGDVLPWGTEPSAPTNTNASPQVSIVYQDREVKMEVEVPGPTQYVYLQTPDRSVTHIYYDEETGHSYKLLDNAKEAVLTNYSFPCEDITNDDGDVVTVSAADWVFPSTVTETTETGEAVTYTVTEISEYCIQSGGIPCRSHVQTVTLPEHLHRIPNSLFVGFEHLTTVNWGNEVTEIGADAFGVCSSLRQIGPMSSVTAIGEKAFHMCTSLTDAGDTGQVTTIGASAYHHCSKLTSFTFGSSLQSIGELAFAESGLTEAVLPDGIDVIGDKAFYRSQVQNASFSHTLLKLGQCVFGECPLKTLRIPYLGRNSLSGIGQSGPLSKLLNQTGTNEYNVGNYAPDSSFRFDRLILYPSAAGDSILTDEMDSYLSLMQYADHITLEDGFSGSLQWFRRLDPEEAAESVDPREKYSLKNLKSLTIGSGITSISYDAFAFSTGTDLPRLEQIKLPDTLTYLGAHTFENCIALKDVTFPETLKTIGSCAFANCIGLETVRFGENLQTIGAHAFEGCSALSDLTLPASLSSVSPYAFGYCTSLENVTVLCPAEAIDPAAFYGASFGPAPDEPADPSRILVLPEGMETLTPGLLLEALEEKAASDYAEIRLPNSLRTIDPQVLKSLPPTVRLTVEKDHPAFMMAERHLFTKDKTTLVRYQNARDADVYLLPDETAAIGPYAMARSKVKYFRTRENSALKTIGAHALENASVEQISLPAGVETIGSCAFEHCGYLSEISFGESLTSIGKRAFFHCTRLKTLTFPDSLTTLGESAFENCPLLEEVTLGGNLRTIGARAFAGCSRLWIVTSPRNSLWDEKIQTMKENHATPYFSALSSLPEGLSTVEESTFEGCALSAVILPDAVSVIGANAFKDNPLRVITIPASLTRIEDSAFENCEPLQGQLQIQYSEGFMRDTVYCYDGLIFPSTLTRIGNRAFCNCSKIKKVYIDHADYSQEDWERTATPVSMGKDAFSRTCLCAFSGAIKAQGDWCSGTFYQKHPSHAWVYDKPQGEEDDAWFIKEYPDMTDNYMDDNWDMDVNWGDNPWDDEHWTKELWWYDCDEDDPWYDEGCPEQDETWDDDDDTWDGDDETWDGDDDTRDDYDKTWDGDDDTWDGYDETWDDDDENLDPDDIDG